MLFRSVVHTEQGPLFNLETSDYGLGMEALAEDADNVALLANLKLTVVTHEGRPVDVTLPLTVDLKVVDTAPEIKGATASAQRKPAVTDTGLTIQVPSFIGPGETVTVDTETGTYVSRAK